MTLKGINHVKFNLCYSMKCGNIKQSNGIRGYTAASTKTWNLLQTPTQLNLTDLTNIDSSRIKG